MGRRLTQAELEARFQHSVSDLQEHLEPPWTPTGAVGNATYVKELAQRQLGWGRIKGVHEAWGFVADQARWGPVHQARAHDAITQRITEVWAERAHAQAQEASADGYETHRRETLDLPSKAPGELSHRAALTMASLGRLDALQAASAAIAGFPERLQVLGDLEHPERARQPTRDHGRKRDRGQGID